MSLIFPPDQLPPTLHGFVSAAPCMHHLFETLARVAKSEATVLIRGESGTGKELVARMLHNASDRAAGPFVSINCATLTPELLASELFGHLRGAFTGAVRDHKGVFERADGGTLFLDEVAELPLGIQARLLRVLQERTFVPVGGTEPRTVNVRVLSATNRALREAVRQRAFREDLMYRVRVVPVFLPRLRDREGDVVALIWHFVGEFNRNGRRAIQAIEGATMERLETYPWPGNVRELRNVVEYAFAVGIGETWTVDELPPELLGVEPDASDDRYITAEELERERIIQAMRSAKGKKQDAAALLGMSRSTLWRKMREYGVLRTSRDLGRGLPGGDPPEAE